MKDGGPFGGRGANRPSRLLAGGRHHDPPIRDDAEFPLHVAIADLIRRAVATARRWTHLPFGEYRSPSTAQGARMGVLGRASTRNETIIQSVCQKPTPKDWRPGSESGRFVSYGDQPRI